ncbi:hypothetical protein UKMH10_5449 [Burkholderia pseudomallei]|nr:hypothetical protein UKMH10_5449 [Burkholderia pseudomallei]
MPDIQCPALGARRSTNDPRMRAHTLSQRRGAVASARPRRMPRPRAPPVPRGAMRARAPR